MHNRYKQRVMDFESVKKKFVINFFLSHKKNNFAFIKKTVKAYI